MTEREAQWWLFQKFQKASAIIVPNYTPYHWRECDVWRVTDTGYTHEYEIKVSLSDFHADSKKMWKHMALQKGHKYAPSMFWYAAPQGLIPHGALPEYAGLIELGCSAGMEVQIIKTAPRLHTIKVDAKQIEHATRACYYRLWTERYRHDETSKRLDLAQARLGYKT